MKIVSHLEKFPVLNKRPVLTMGFFDGFHKGHQRLICKAVKIAKLNNRSCWVLTFLNHPDEVLKKKVPEKLMTLNERLESFKKTGVDGTVLIKFTNKLANLEAEEFVKKICDKINPFIILTGENFYFGRKGYGNPKLLKKLSKTFNYKYIKIPLMKWKNSTVSSSIIRALIKKRKIDIAYKLLKEPFSITSKVVHGEGLGKKIGYPTVNFSSDKIYKMIPPEGVYHTITSTSDFEKPSVTFIGKKNIKGYSKTVIETHIPDFNKDLYGRVLTVKFLKFIRKPKKFRTKTEMLQNIKKDVEKIKEASKQ